MGARRGDRCAARCAARNRVSGMGAFCRCNILASSNASNAPMLCPYKANGFCEYSCICPARVSTRGRISVYGDSRRRFSRPGNCTGHTSMVEGSARAQVLYIEAPPPANGKQKSRNRAVGLGTGQVIQSLNFWLIDFGSPSDVADYNLLNVSLN